MRSARLTCRKRPRADSAISGKPARGERGAALLLVVVFTFLAVSFAGAEDRPRITGMTPEEVGKVQAATRVPGPEAQAAGERAKDIRRAQKHMWKRMREQGHPVPKKLRGEPAPGQVVERAETEAQPR